jgi:hypothetical protein
MKMFFRLGLLSALLLTIGCGPTNVATKNNDVGMQTNSKYVSTTEPKGAIPVGEAREVIADGQEVTLVGLIGGSSKPFVDGLAAFTIVDPKVPYCADEEGCPTPWDYCCQTDAVKQNIATIKVVDEAGKLVEGNAKELLNVKELSTVVIQGKAKRDDLGNLTVAASKVYVQPGK